MKQSYRIRDMLLGAIIAILVLQLCIPALAAMVRKTIEVSTGINVYVNDKPVDMVDAGGMPVEAFAYNGTTYLPIRAISTALGQPVQWDGQTQSVYIGSHSSDEPSMWLTDMDYFAGNGDEIKTVTTERDNMGNSHYHCFTSNFTRTYKVDGQYSKLTGTVYQRYDHRSSYISHNSILEIYGDGKLLHVVSFEDNSTGFEPSPFSIDLTGVLELKINFVSKGQAGYNTYASVIALGDCGLWS